MHIEMCSFFLALISGFLLWNRVESLQFDVESGQTKCIAEEIKINSMTIGKYHIVNPNEGHPLPVSHNITIGVTSMYGNVYYHEDNVIEGQFAFQAIEGGDYLACFYAAENEPSVSVTIDLNWKFGLDAKDWPNIAKKGSIEVMEIELKRMFVNVQSIHEEMLYLRDREKEMQELNTSTNSEIARLGVLSIFICLSVATLQLRHLVCFFKKEKHL